MYYLYSNTTYIVKCLGVEANGYIALILNISVSFRDIKVIKGGIECEDHERIGKRFG